MQLPDLLGQAGHNLRRERLLRGDGCGGSAVSAAVVRRERTGVVARRGRWAHSGGAVVRFMRTMMCMWRFSTRCVKEVSQCAVWHVHGVRLSIPRERLAAVLPPSTENAFAAPTHAAHIQQPTFKRAPSCRTCAPAQAASTSGGEHTRARGGEPRPQNPHYLSLSARRCSASTTCPSEPIVASAAV